ncbi:oxygen-binding di-iron domain-containing protein [Caminibacter sp.]
MGFNSVVKLNENVYWVGCSTPKLLNSNVYLFKDEDVGVLIDPAWTQAECLVDKVTQVMEMDKIKYVVVQNYEPDTVKMLSSLEKIIPDFTLVTHWKIAMFLNKFDFDFDIYSIDENEWKLKVKEKELNFIFTPFNYFAGSFCTYDKETKTLFSSELFSAVKNKFQLFVDREPLYLLSVKTFHELYLPLEYMKNAILSLPEEIKMVAPRYGSVLEDEFIKKVKEELLQIKIQTNFEETKEKIITAFYKYLLENSIDVAISKIYSDIESVFSKLLNLKLKLNHEEYTAGVETPNAKHTIVKIDTLSDNTKIELIGSFGSVLKEEEKAFFDDLLSRLLKAIMFMFEKQLTLKEKEPILDDTTGVFSRAYLTAVDKKVFSAAKRHKYPVAVGLIELDIDKHIGKLYEECVIRECAKILQRNFRSSDIIIREDEEAFLIIMPFTEVENANKKIQHIIGLLNKHEFCGSKKIHIKAKAHVIEYDGMSEIKEIIERLKNPDDRKVTEWI